MHPGMMKAFASLLFLFSAAQLLGLHAGAFLSLDARHNEVVEQLRPYSPSDAFGAFYIFGGVLAGAAFMYLLVKFYRGELLFALIEFAVVSFSSSIVFYSFIKPVLAATAISIALAVLAGAAFAALNARHHSLKNVAAVVATAGAGAFFGFSLTFQLGMVFIVLLSIYDYIAVFKTGHMVELADALSKRKTSFMISSSERTEKGTIKLELGTGDLLAPIILEVSGLELGPAYPAIVFAGALFSIFVLFALMTRKRTVLPAMPIIAASIFLSLGISKAAGII